MQRAMDCAGEKGASSRLSALPIIEHGFTLHKGTFRDVPMFMVRMAPRSFANRIGGVANSSQWTTCTLGCPCGGFPSLRHNEIRDVTANLLNEICHNVSTKPELQPLSSDHSQNSQHQRWGLPGRECSRFLGRPVSMHIFDVQDFNP